MTILSTLQIGEVIYQAMVFDAKKWWGHNMNSDTLIQAVQNLFAVLEQRHINYVLVGGIALLHYVEGRNTQDIDLLMASSSLSKLPELEVSNQDLDFARAAYGDLQIDILLTQNPLFRKVQAGYSQVEQFFDRQIPIATVEGLLLLKLMPCPPSIGREILPGWASTKTISPPCCTTITLICQALLAELSNFVNESDMAEIKTILTEIQDPV